MAAAAIDDGGRLRWAFGNGSGRMITRNRRRPRRVAEEDDGGRWKVAADGYWPSRPLDHGAKIGNSSKCL